MPTAFYTRRLPHLYYILLAALALVYYKERIIHIDVAAYFYHIVQYKTFTTPHDRFISIFTQLLPLAGAHAGLSLKALLLLYSVSFVLFSYIIYLLLTRVFDQPFAGMVNAVVAVTGVFAGFFYPVSEVFLAVSMLCLLLGFCLSERALAYPPWLYWPVFILLLFLTFTAHSMIVPPLFICMAAVMIFGKKFPLQNGFIGFAILFFLVVVKFLTLSGYEREFGMEMRKGITKLAEFRTFMSYRYLAAGGWKIIAPAGIFMIINSIVLLMKARRKFFLWYFAGMVVLFLLSLCTYYRGYYGVNVLEIAFYPLVFFSLLPLVFYPELFQRRNLLLAVISASVLFSVYQVYALGKRQKKITLLKNHVISDARNQGGNKFYACPRTLPVRLEACWSFGVETLLLSSLYDPENTVTIYFIDDPEILKRRNDPYFIFISHFENGSDRDTRKLDRRYFRGMEGYYNELRKTY